MQFTMLSRKRKPLINDTQTLLGLSHVSALSLSGISTLIAKGVYDAAFPLHDVSAKSPETLMVLMCFTRFQFSVSGNILGVEILQSDK